MATTITIHNIVSIGIHRATPATRAENTDFYIRTIEITDSDGQTHVIQLTSHTGDLEEITPHNVPIVV